MIKSQYLSELIFWHTFGTTKNRKNKKNNNMKSFFNFLRKNKLYTFVEVVGMSIALAFVIYISTYVSEQLTRDSEIKGQIAYGVGRVIVCL